MTVALPSPEEICDPLDDDFNSSPRYLIDVMSQLFALTVKTRAFVEPASTTMLSPLLVTPNAARTEEEYVAAANNALFSNMSRNVADENIDGVNLK